MSSCSTKKVHTLHCTSPLYAPAKSPLGLKRRIPLRIRFKTTGRNGMNLERFQLSDVQCNFASHKKYKQEYTTWERESKEGGITHG